MRSLKMAFRKARFLSLLPFMQLTITLPPELEQKLATQAARLNIPLEHLVLQSLEQTAQQAAQLENDPLIALFGSFRSDVPDLGDNHDHYIGQALYQEMNCVE
jgi:UDP-N-acetyl-D-mannosaminuronate dehydrogenase